MKKSIFLLAAGALALSACTSEVILESGNHGNVIGFENAISKQTRADVVDLTNGGLSHFNVFGYYTAPNNTVKAIGVFDDQDVTKVGSNTWSYGDSRYWVPGGQYYFYAYSCDNSPLKEDYGTFAIDLGGSNTEARALGIKGYRCDDKHQHDLIFASAGPIEGKEKGSNDPVSLKFTHLLTKINATFTSKFPETYNIEISNVTVEGVRNFGDYNSYNKTWTTTADKTGKVNLWINEEEGDECLTASGTTVAVTNSAYVLPCTISETDATKVKIKFDITIRDKKTKEGILTRNMSGTWGPTWEIGHKYTYNIEIDGSTAELEAIVFVVDEDEEGNSIVSGWADGDSTDITLSAH